MLERGVTHISLGRLVPLDTRWRAQQWAEQPTGPLDADYAESIMMAQQTFEHVASGKTLQAATVRDLVQLLMYKVARSNAALSQILAVKQYQNLTYCHSVNVSMLSLLIGRQIGLDEDTLAALVEASLLHDIGKTRIPLDVVKKPGALDKQERRLMESHTTFGGEILVQIDGLRPLTPLVALEHHRTVKGGGYPDLGDGAIPHPMSQIVSVADIYEAITGARTYQAPASPERACLILARLAGDKLNTSLVKTFVNAITFFPIGSLVRTTQEQLAVVDPDESGRSAASRRGAGGRQPQPARRRARHGAAERGGGLPVPRAGDGPAAPRHLRRPRIPARPRRLSACPQRSRYPSGDGRRPTVMPVERLSVELPSASIRYVTSASLKGFPYRSISTPGAREGGGWLGRRRPPTQSRPLWR